MLWLKTSLASITFSLLLIIFSLESLSAATGPFRVISYTTLNGMAGNDVQVLYQDSRGFIWIGTSEGLSQFDGVQFRNFETNPNDPNDVSDNFITAIAEDREGKIWIGTLNGLNCFDYHTRHFLHFTHDAHNEQSLSSNTILSVAIDTSGLIWVGTSEGGLHRLEKITSAKSSTDASYRITRFLHDATNTHSISGNYVSTICFDGENRGWLGTNHGISFFIPGKKDLVFYSIKNNRNDSLSLASNFVFRLRCDDSNFIWASSRGMLDRLWLPAHNVTTARLRIIHTLPLLRQFRKEAFTINDMIVDAHHNGWISVFEFGLARIHFTSDSIRIQITKIDTFNYQPQFVYGLPSQGISYLYEDHEKNIWVATAEGLSAYNYRQELFQLISLKNKAQHPLKESINTFFVDSKDIVWIGGTDNNLWILQDTLQNEVHLPSDHLDAGSNAILSILRSSVGDLYLGSVQGLFVIGASQVDMVRKGDIPTIINHYHKQVGQLSGNIIRSIYEDPQGMIWLGTDGGLVSFNPTSKAFHAYTLKDSLSQSTSVSISSFTSLTKEYLCMGTDKGLFVFNTTSGSYRQYSQGNSEVSALKSNEVNCMCPGDSGCIWIGTPSGLTCFTKDQKFLTISGENYFNHIPVYAIAEDEKHNLWITCRNGLISWNYSSNEIITEDKSVLPDVSFESYPAFKGIGGKVFLGSADALIAFNPKQLPVPAKQQTVYLTDFKIYNHSILQDSSGKTREEFLHAGNIHLLHDENFFTIDFAMPVFFNADKTTYEYRLQGIDKGWVPAENRRFANYTKLPPGNYSFIVRARNNSGGWSETDHPLSIFIAAPWWQTVWFFIACFITVAAALYLIYRYRIGQIRKYYALRAKIARDLHDDVGSTLSSISMMSAMAHERMENKNAEDVALYGVISNASHEAMELMSDIVWSVNPKNDKIENVLARMRSYAGELLEAKNITLRFEVPEVLKDLNLPMSKRKDFYLIFKEAVNNLSKYSECSNVLIRMEKESDILILTITDDGVGFEVEGNYSGNGIKNMHDRAGVIEGKLLITSSPGKGTVLRLEIPFTP